MGLLAFQRLGQNAGDARLWIESQRLNTLGFSHGTPIEAEKLPDKLTLRPAILSNNHVSSRVVPTGRRPIIDLANQSLLSGLTEFSELKIIASFERIEVTPSHRAFAIQRSRLTQPPFRVLEVFAGGGTMTEALKGNMLFSIAAGVEIEVDYADEWQVQNPDALLIQSDIHSLHSSEVPPFDVIIGGIPCTNHSNLGRAKKGLAGKPEVGDTGGLFISVLEMVAERMPAALVFENVPNFATSLAGELFVHHLKRLGYHVFTTILKPNQEWGEIEDRKRWLLVATLNESFSLVVPNVLCATPVAAYLDPPNDIQDRSDAESIAATIEGLRRHNARHEALGHGFGFTVVDGSETKLPTIPKSYHKINTGPFVQTEFGPRLLRQAEIERIHGCKLNTQHYSTAVQVLGQGVQTRVFRDIFAQLGKFFRKICGCAAHDIDQP